MFFFSDLMISAPSKVISISFLNIRLRWWWILKNVRDYKELRKMVWNWCSKITWDRTWSMNIWENIIRLSEVVLILVDWTICGRNICKKSESKNSFVGACLLYFKKVNIKVTTNENRFIFLRNFIKQSI